MVPGSSKACIDTNEGAARLDALDPPSDLRRVDDRGERGGARFAFLGVVLLAITTAVLASTRRRIRI